MPELVQGHSERGTIKIVTRAIAPTEFYLCIGGMLFQAKGNIPAVQFERWLTWLAVPVENWTRKEI